MKRLALLPLLFALTGCSIMAHEDGDWFEASGHTVEQFERDNQACHIQATDKVVNNWSRSYDSVFGENRAFNAVYSRCMKDRNYRPRAYVENWLPS